MCQKLFFRECDLPNIDKDICMHQLLYPHYYQRILLVLSTYQAQYHQYCYLVPNKTSINAQSISAKQLGFYDADLFQKISLSRQFPPVPIPCLTQPGASAWLSLPGASGPSHSSLHQLCPGLTVWPCPFLQRRPDFLRTWVRLLPGVAAVPSEVWRIPTGGAACDT